MKKQFALGLLAAVAASGAFAQSSVTIYGRLNVTVESQKFGDDDRQSNVVDNASRIGFKGVEDLGGGLKAGFQIEHGFDATTGAASSAFWGRQSEVNLSGGFGTVRLGRWTPESYFATADYISMHNHDTGSSSDALYAYGPWSTSNKVGYVSPMMGGFQFHASVSEAAGNGGSERMYDLAANYDMGKLHLGAGFAKQDEVKQFAIRGLYEFGAFTVGAYYNRDTDSWGSGFGSRNTIRLSGMYAFGANEIHLNVGRANAYSDVDDSSATQMTVGYNYNLSKRTKVYGYYTRLSDGDAAVYGGDFNSFALGVRHNF